MTATEAQEARPQVTDLVENGILAVNMAPLRENQARRWDERYIPMQQDETDESWHENVARTLAKAVVSAIPQHAVPADEAGQWVSQDDEGRNLEVDHGLGTLTRLVEVRDASASSRREILRLVYQPTRLHRAQSHEAILNQAVLDACIA